MGRPKEFEREEALSKAMGVFWEKGFECTSVQDLVHSMGIGRASLYDTFGSKQDLFTEVLDRYETLVKENVLAPLARTGPARKILRQLFTRQAEQQCSKDVPTCLLVKSAVLTARTDPQTQERVSRLTAMLDDAFYDLLRRARAAGEIGSDKNLRALARYLTHSMHALSVSGATRRDPKVVREIVRTTLTVLG